MKFPKRADISVCELKEGETEAFAFQCVLNKEKDIKLNNYWRKFLNLVTNFLKKI